VKYSSLELLGCCGAYCGPCKALIENACKGCKLGYKNGERDIAKARCKIKICCMKNSFNSCADCDKYSSCRIIQELHNKNGYKYKKYKEAILYIRTNGYEKFFEIANKWKMQYGRYK
jgi:hypothetical protein